ARRARATSTPREAAETAAVEATVRAAARAPVRAESAAAGDDNTPGARGARRHFLPDVRQGVYKVRDSSAWKFRYGQGRCSMAAIPMDPSTGGAAAHLTNVPTLRHSPQACRWGDSTLYMAFPEWLGAWDTPWTCRHPAHAGPLETVD